MKKLFFKSLNDEVELECAVLWGTFALLLFFL